MRVTIRYFASLREALGPSETLNLDVSVSVGELRDQLIARGGPYGTALARGRAVRCALNQVLCSENAQVGDGAELAFFPPVTGG